MYRKAWIESVVDWYYCCWHALVSWLSASVRWRTLWHAHEPSHSLGISFHFHCHIMSQTGVDNSLKVCDNALDLCWTLCVWKVRGL